MYEIAPVHKLQCYLMHLLFFLHYRQTMLKDMECGLPVLDKGLSVTSLKLLWPKMMGAMFKN